MEFKRLKFVVFGVMAFVVIFVAFKITYKDAEGESVNTNSGEGVQYENSIRLGVCNFDTINPITTKNQQMIYINQLVYEPLLELDEEYKINLCLATEYAKTAATTYIIKVDNGVKWSSGTNFSAKDVKFTVELLKSVDNIYTENVKYISSVEAIDDSTVKISLSQEVPFFEYNLIFPIMSQEYYSGEDFFIAEKFPVGTGKYKITSVSNSQIVLEKNESYRYSDKQNKNIQKIDILIFDEIGEVYNSFKLGNIDLMNTSSLLYENYIGTIGYYVKEYKGREFDFLSCNCNDYLMKQKSVRQAVSLAIDKDNIVSTMYNNKYYASEYILDYGSYLYESTSVSSGYNPEKAKEILLNDGWVYSNNRWRKDGNILSLTISVNASNTERCEVANLIKSQLENIGIVVNVKQISDSQYSYYLANKNYQILLTGVYNSYSPDINYFYGIGNIANYKNDNVINSINDVKNITDQEILKQKYTNIINTTKEDCVCIGLYRNMNFLLINQNVVGNFEPSNYSLFYNFESWNREK